MRLVRLLIFTFISLMVFTVQSIAAPAGFVYQGQIVKPNGDNLEADTVVFTVEIYSPNAEECLLYQETHTLNLAGSKGLFSLVIGDGTRSGADYEDTSTLADVFDNSLPLQTPTTCDSVGTYTPANGDDRLLRITFDEGGGPITLSQDQRIKSVPFAQHAAKLDGRDATDFINVNDGAGQELNQANIDSLFTTANYNELVALISGTSTQYLTTIPTANLDMNSNQINNLSNPIAGTDAANKNYVDANIGGVSADTATISALGPAETGRILLWNGSEWTASVPAGDSSKLPLAGGTMAGSIDMGANDLLNARDMSLTNDITVGNDVLVTGGIGVGTGINSSGNIQVTNQNEVRFGDADNSNYVGFVAPATLLGDQTWELPLNDGLNGYALTTNGSGQLSFTDIDHDALTNFVANEHIDHTAVSMATA
ncbi:MAG: hypothetical protein HRT44_03680, partial [Bdellovibrionales bacterium]|nr:hypothetical protein [Bdellovibrionales bacterium]NQZ18344.1 hypothetical protein [Bdellovibrionales bacterium]